MKKFLWLLFTLFMFFGCTSTSVQKGAEVVEELTPQKLIEMGRIEEAKELFSSKVDINNVDEHGNTALHIAAKMDDADLCTYLLCKGIDPNLKNYDSDTALHVAVNYDSYDSARVLAAEDGCIFTRDAKNLTAFEKAIDKSETYYDIMITSRNGTICDDEGQTIIHYFAKSGNEKAINFAIKKNLPIDEKDSAGITPLAISLQNMENESSVKICADLIKAGAKPIDCKYSYFEEAVEKRNMSFRQKDGETPLHISASLGHFAITKYLLENYASVKAQDISGSTALHCAVRSGNIDIARLLLENGADVNALDTLGKTPLLLIIPQEKQFEMYTLLLEKNADTKKHDSYGDSVLHVATLMNSSSEVLKLLIKCGADVNARNKDGETPLLMAVQMNSIDQIGFYVRNGADINAYDVNGNSPLTVSFTQEILTAKTLITKDNVDAVDSKGNAAIHTAVLKNAPLAIFTYITQLTNNIDARNAEGNTALYLAIQKNRRDMGEVLLNLDSDIFITNTKNYSPLHLAFTMGGDISEWLITSKTIKATDGSGNTAMHYACEWQEVGAITLLTEKGADINAKNANGETPLFSAVKADNPGVIALLVENGAEMNARDNSGNTALHSAVRWKTFDSALALINNGCSVDAQNSSGITPLAEAVANGNKPMCNMLIGKGADVNSTDAEGRSILINAVRRQNSEMTDLLLKNKAQINIQEMDGKNVFHEAVLTENVEIISKIQKAGGAPLSRDKNGNTPFALALNKNEEIIRAVAGSNKNIADSDGNSLMHIAVANKAKPVIINTMLEEKFPCDTRNAAGYTPLYLAATSGQTYTADALLAGGANPFTACNSKEDCTVSFALQTKNQALLDTITKYAYDKSDYKGNTILHYAAKTADAETVKNLIARGLNPKAKNIEGQTPYDIAVNWQKTDVAELLK